MIIPLSPAGKLLVGLTPIVVFLTYLPLSTLPANTDPYFFNHALFMTLGVLTVSFPSILVRQLKGRVPTKVHGLLMILACVFMTYAWYVIHSIKTANSKSHLTSYHGLAGALTTVTLLVLTAAGFLLFEPDWRLAGPRADRLRAILKQPHKWTGRLWLLFAVAVLISGFRKKISSQVVLGTLVAGLTPLILVTFRTALKARTKTNLNIPPTPQ